MRSSFELEKLKVSGWYFCCPSGLAFPSLPGYKRYANQFGGFPCRKSGGFPCRLCIVFNHLQGARHNRALILSRPFCTVQIQFLLMSVHTQQLCIHKAFRLGLLEPDAYFLQYVTFLLFLVCFPFSYSGSLGYRFDGSIYIHWI